MTPRLGLSIPLFNEEEVVDQTVKELRAALEAAGVSARLALVDNGSTDQTCELVRALEAAHPALVLGVFLPKNRGYGGGIRAGLSALDQPGGPAVLGWTWGDGQVDPAVLPGLLAACEAGAPMAKARRVLRQDGAVRQVVTWGWSTLARACGLRTPDLHGCPKLFRVEALRALDLQSDDWLLDAEAVLQAEQRGWSIVDAPVVMRPRLAGRSKVRASTAWSLGRGLVRWRITGHLR